MEAFLAPLIQNNTDDASVCSFLHNWWIESWVKINTYFPLRYLRQVFCHSKKANWDWYQGSVMISVNKSSGVVQHPWMTASWSSECLDSWMWKTNIQASKNQTKTKKYFARQSCVRWTSQNRPLKAKYPRIVKPFTLPLWWVHPSRFDRCQTVLTWYALFNRLNLVSSHIVLGSNFTCSHVLLWETCNFLSFPFDLFILISTAYSTKWPENPCWNALKIPAPE